MLNWGWTGRFKSFSTGWAALQIVTSHVVSSHPAEISTPEGNRRRGRGQKLLSTERQIERVASVSKCQIPIRKRLTMMRAPRHSRVFGWRLNLLTFLQNKIKSNVVGTLAFEFEFNHSEARVILWVYDHKFDLPLRAHRNLMLAQLFHSKRKCSNNPDWA